MNVKKWEILQSEYIHRCKWVTLRRDRVQQPSGRIINEFYVLEYPEWISVIAITQEGKFIMERQYRHGIQRYNYEICAGTVEPGEEPLKAAQRELQEETGFTGGGWSLFNVCAPNSSAMTNHCYTFVAKDVIRGEACPEPTEDIEVMELEWEQVLELLKGGEIPQSDMQAVLWKFAAQKL